MFKGITSIFLIFMCAFSSVTNQRESLASILYPETFITMQRKVTTLNADNSVPVTQELILRAQRDCSNDSTHHSSESHRAGHQCHVGHCAFTSVNTSSFDSPTQITGVLHTHYQRAISVYLGIPLKPPTT